VVCNQVFTDVPHVFCALHIEGNVQRYLRDEAGVPVKEREQVVMHLRSILDADPNDSLVLDEHMFRLTEAGQTAASRCNDPQKVEKYIMDTVVPKLRNNMQVCTTFAMHFR